MGKGKKPFIDKKKSVTFHLVHRSQHDPLVTDESAPQHVLVEAQSKPKKPSENAESRHEEQRKYGIMFDDDYDYLQHLKKSDDSVVWERIEKPNHQEKPDQTKITLPSSVFASEYEESDGLLNRSAPYNGLRLDWDPDVIAALDDDFDFENNEIEDDFVLRAMNTDCDENEEDGTEDDVFSGSESDHCAQSEGHNIFARVKFINEEVKSRFTEYSMTSNVIRRNDQLSLLDDRFEKFYENYDDNELGDLSMENIDGIWHQKHPYVLNCLKSSKSSEIEPYNKDWDRVRLARYRESTEDYETSSNSTVTYDTDEETTNLECESMSTKSINRPKLITEPSSNSKTKINEVGKIEIDTRNGMPVNILNGKNITMKTLSNLNKTVDDDCISSDAKTCMTTLNTLSLRPKDETPEEKRLRKKLIKEYRKERRIEKKANTEAFKLYTFHQMRNQCKTNIFQKRI